MADNQRNQGNENRFSTQEWDNDYNRQQRSWEDRYQGNQGAQENRDYGYSGNRYNRQSEGENSGNRWNQESGMNRGSQYGSRMGSDYNSGNYGNQDRNYGYGGREYGSSYGGGLYQGNSSYYDSGAYGNTGRSSYGNSRNLYDRDYERFDRGFNSGYSGMGGSNYDRAEGRRSRDENPYYGSTNPSNYRGYSGSNYGGNYYGGNRDFGRGDTNERSWWDRTRDEVSSWFGDDEAERRRERDNRLNFRGRGPRNYSRSDDRIKEDVNDRLSDDPWVDASDLEVTVSSAEVTLTGTVNDRSEKRRAEDLAEAVSGVKNVENRIRVGKREGTTMGTGTTGSTSGTYAGSETSATQSGVTGTTGSTTDKNKSKSNYVTG
jgi:osmotically-inducible protein OsmY